jgi:hypothetical protein
LFFILFKNTLVYILWLHLYWVLFMNQGHCASASSVNYGCPVTM